jgi:hypothetical protein
LHQGHDDPSKLGVVSALGNEFRVVIGFGANFHGGDVADAGEGEFEGGADGFIVVAGGVLFVEISHEEKPILHDGPEGKLIVSEPDEDKHSHRTSPVGFDLPGLTAHEGCAKFALNGFAFPSYNLYKPVVLVAFALVRVIVVMQADFGESGLQGS